MTLPITIQMQIDLTAAAHKREIAEGFAKLRAKLLPEPPDPFRDLFRNVWDDVKRRHQQIDLMPQRGLGLAAGPLQAMNAAYNAQSIGLQSPFHGLWGFGGPGRMF